MDATFSAALMPKRHFLSAVFGDGLDIDLMPEGGRSISFDPGKAMIGGAFGQLGQVDVGTGALFKMLKTGPAAKFIYGDFVPGLFFGSMKEIAVEGVSDN